MDRRDGDRRRRRFVFSFDADAQALFDRMAVQPDATRKGLINDFMVGIKGDLSIANLSDAFDILYFTAGHNQADTRLNWVNSSHTLSEVNSPTWTLDRGYTGNGLTMYLDTNYNPATQAVNFSRNDGSIGVYIRTNVNESRMDFGSVDLAVLGIISRQTNLFFGGVNQASFIGSATADSRGLSTAERSASNAISKYKNGVQVDTGVIVSLAIDSRNPYILARNLSGVADTFSTKQAAFAFIGSSSSINQANLFTRVEAYLDAIGAGVI